ncbi:MAG: hypothetical protein V3W09_04175 [Nitrososphaerales archaeon]
MSATKDRLFQLGGVPVPMDPFTAGNEFIVNKDHPNASDSNPGTLSEPLLTVQRGVNFTVSGNHDVVRVVTAATAYAENVTVTSKDYVSIIGVGRGHWGRPDIHPTTGVALAVSLSQGFHGERIYFLSDDDDAVTMDSEGWQFNDCKFQGSSDGLLLKGHATNDSYAAGQGLAYVCTFEANGAAGVRLEHAEASSGVGAWGNQFHNCLFRDNTGADFLSAVGASGGGAGIFLAMEILGCRFLDIGAGHVYMDMDQGVGADLAANQCLIVANWFADEAVVAAQIAVGSQANVMVVGNYDAAGLINGATFND